MTAFGEDIGPNNEHWDKRQRQLEALHPYQEYEVSPEELAGARSAMLEEIATGKVCNGVEKLHQMVAEDPDALRTFLQLTLRDAEVEAVLLGEGMPLDDLT